jgi:hypothetical protein
MTMAIDNTALEALRSNLNNATVYTADSPNYKESLVRWSDTGIRYAVRDRTRERRYPTDFW